MSAEILSNLESIGDLVGSYMGLADGVEEDEYVESLIKQAHGHAAHAFDIAAAATATAGYLSHVYEFGTAGITRGPIRYPDPVQPEARLWVHEIHGQGGQQDIEYRFRPATNRNPQPTVAQTGVSSKYLAKLSKRKYIFWNKAYVMETGQEVEAHAKNSDFLFVPFGQYQADDPRNTRGFVMYNTSKLGPIVSRPGRDTKGTFTAFWLTWWASDGEVIMEEEMRKKVAMDMRKAEAEIEKRVAAVPVKPVEATNVVGATNTARVWMKKVIDVFRRPSGEDEIG